MLVLLLCVCFVFCLGDDVTINGEDVPYKQCSGPTYSSHDMGYVILIAAGAGMVFGFFALTIVFLALVVFKPEFKLPIVGWKLYSLRVPILLLGIVIFILGVPMLVTGAYYGHWSKLYDIRGGCVELTQVSPDQPLPIEALSTPINLTVAYVGDSGANSDSIKIYQLVASEGAELLVHAGDYDYCDDPTMFLKQLNATLGSDIQFISTIGNHDLHVWGEYEEELLKRWAGKPTSLQCSGTLFVNYWCVYKGVFIAFSSVGTKCGYGYTNYTWHESSLNDMLTEANSLSVGSEKLWLTCAWHKNQRLMQVGDKSDETGYGVYDLCSQEGALVVTGHNHAYARSHQMSDVSAQTVTHTCSNTSNCSYNLTLGGAIVTVVGTGGHELVDLDTTLSTLPHWALAYNSKLGALFCKYNYNGVAGVAYCYFKTEDGEVVDDFFLVKN